MYMRKYANNANSKSANQTERRHDDAGETEGNKGIGIEHFGVDVALDKAVGDKTNQTLPLKDDQSYDRHSPSDDMVDARQQYRIEVGFEEGDWNIDGKNQVPAIESAKCDAEMTISKCDSELTCDEPTRVLRPRAQSTQSSLEPCRPSHLALTPLLQQRK